MAPYFAEHASVVLTPAGRRPNLTLMKETGTRQWEVQQRIMDPESHGDWMLDGEIDLRDRRAEGEPLLILRRIGV